MVNNRLLQAPYRLHERRQHRMAVTAHPVARLAENARLSVLVEGHHRARAMGWKGRVRLGQQRGVVRCGRTLHPRKHIAAIDWPRGSESTTRGLEINLQTVLQQADA